MTSRRRKVATSKTPTRDPRKLGCDCDACPLKGRPPVFSKPRRKGNSNTPCTLAIVGEAPGRNEERESEFFVGASGYELNKACMHYRIPQEQLHINNALLCRPARKLSPDEWRQAVACCKPRLTRELKRHKPKAVLVMGSHALGCLTDRWKIKEWSGAPLKSADVSVPVLGTWHPAFAMRKPHMWPIFYRHFERAWNLARGKLSKWKWPKIVIEPNAAMVAALNKLNKQAKLVGMDVETAGPDPRAPLTAIGLASKHLAVSCPWPPERFAPTPAIARQIRTAIKAVLANPRIEKAAQNGNHDVIAFRKAKMPIRGYRWDTMLMHGVLAPALPHDLGFLASGEFHADKWKAEYNVSGDHKGMTRWVKALDKDSTRRDLCIYNAKDSAILAFLVPEYIKQLGDCFNGMDLYEGYFERADIAARMRENGALLNRKALKDHHQKLSARRTRALNEFRAAAKSAGWRPQRVAAKKTRKPLTAAAKKKRAALAKGINPLSHIQIGELFFGKLNVQPTKWSDKTNKPSLDAKSLQNLVTHPNVHVARCARTLLMFRRFHKLISTYVIRMLPSHKKSYADEDWIIHPDARVQGTKGGRWSYKSPNCQNIPKPRFEVKRLRGNKTKKILITPGLRDIIRPRPGHYLCEADYSQLELRIIALLAGDPVLLDLYARGVDVHTENAKALFHTATPTKEQRDLAKRFVYGVNYGGDAQTIWRSLVVDFPSLSLDDVERLKEVWYMLHPQIKIWQKEGVKKAYRDDYVECPLSGRRQTFFKRVEETKVYNYPVQGTGADIIDAAIVKVDRHIKRHKNGILLFQIHDALIVEGPDLVGLAEMLQKYMTVPVTLGGKRIAFPIDWKVSNQDWGHCAGCDTIAEVKAYQRTHKPAGPIQLAA